MADRFMNKRRREDFARHRRNALTAIERLTARKVGAEFARAERAKVIELAIAAGMTRAEAERLEAESRPTAVFLDESGREVEP